MSQEAATTEEIARRLFQVYAQHAEWKDFRGQPLPTWDEVKDVIKSHWKHVAEDICIHGVTKDANDLRLTETARQ